MVHASWRAKQSLNQCSMWTAESEDWSFPAFLVSWRPESFLDWDDHLIYLISSGKQIFQGHGNACRSSIHLSLCWVDDGVAFGHCARACLHPFHISMQKRKKEKRSSLMVEPFCWFWFVIPSIHDPLNQQPELNCKKCVGISLASRIPCERNIWNPPFFCFFFDWESFFCFFLVHCLALFAKGDVTEHHALIIVSIY